MKKKTAFLLTGLCVLALLAGCGKEKTENKKDSGNKESSTSISESLGGKTGEYVKLGEYKGLEVSVEKAEVTEEDIRAYVESMLASYPAYENLDKTVVENGDSVNIDYEGLLDGEAFDGGTASNQVLVIGSGSFIDGFEEGLIGAKVGDTLALNLSFPDPYPNNSELAGKAVVFNVTVNAIVQKLDMTYDTLTDEYISSNFGQENVDAFKEDVKANLETTNEYYAQNNMRNAIVNKLQEICTVDSLPEGLLDERVKDYKEQFEAMCKEQNDMTLAEYLEQIQQTEEDFDTQTVEYMEKNLKLEMILLAIGEKESIEVDEEGYQQFLSSMMTNYGFESQDALVEQYGDEYLKDSYICNKVMEMLMENASVTYTEPAEEPAADENASAGEESAADEDASAGEEPAADEDSTGE